RIGQAATRHEPHHAELLPTHDVRRPDAARFAVLHRVDHQHGSGGDHFHECFGCNRVVPLTDRLAVHLWFTSVRRHITSGHCDAGNAMGEVFGVLPQRVYLRIDEPDVLQAYDVHPVGDVCDAQTLVLVEHALVVFGRVVLVRNEELHLVGDGFL